MILRKERFSRRKRSLGKRRRKRIIRRKRATRYRVIISFG
jgi:hypothetical protein